MIHSQLQQFINLGLLLLLGKYAAHIYLPWKDIFFIMLVTVSVEHLMLYIKRKEIAFFSFSSLSTATGVMLMMVTPHLWIVVLLIASGLFQKHFLTYKEKHIFNPSNFALMTGLLFFYHDAHIVLGQLGDSKWLVMVVLVLAASILYRVDRWVIPLGFSLFYLLFEYLFLVKSDPVLIMESVYDRLYSVSFIVFVLFMLTDPKTTPKRYGQQLLFATLVAFGATLLDYCNGFRVQHLFMALFATAPTVPLYANWQDIDERKRVLLLCGMMLFLALSAIIYIEMQEPYYFEMSS